MTGGEMTCGQSPAQLARSKIYAGVPDDDVALALAICRKYGLDPLLRHVVLIKGRVKDGEQWVTRYSLYITRDGLLDIAHRSGIPWSISFAQPVRAENPYTGKPDIYLEGTLHREGHPPYSAGLWFSEYAQRGKEGPLGAWASHPASMHQKVVEVYLLRRGFNVALTPLEEVQAVVQGEIVEPARDADTGEDVAPPVLAEPQIQAPVQKPITGTKEERLAFNDVARTAKAKGWTDDAIRALLNEAGDYRKATEMLIDRAGKPPKEVANDRG